MTIKSWCIFVLTVAVIFLLPFPMVFVNVAGAEDPTARTQTSTAIPSPSVAAQEEALPSKTVVVGNKDTRRYHLPGMSFYKKVKKNHRVYFESEQQAIDNGYYKAGTGKDATKQAPAGKEIKTKSKPKAVEESPKLTVKNIQEKVVKKETVVDVSAAKPPSNIADAAGTGKDDAKLVPAGIAEIRPTAAVASAASKNRPPNALPDTVAAQPLTLEESIAIALKNSLVINIAREGAKGAEARKREAMTGFLPKFSTTYSYTRLNEEPNFYFPGFSFGGITIPASYMSAGTIDNYNWVIEARQPLFAGGGILANYQASKIAEDAALVEETAKSQDVVQDVKIAYYNILRAQRLGDTARQAVEMLAAHRDVAENFYRVGLIPKNDLLQVEVELANGKQTLVRAQNAVELAKSRMNTVLKRELLSPMEVVDILDHKPLNKSFEECLDIARQNRPELKISRLMADQARKMVRMAQSEYFPTVSLVGDYTRFGDTPSVSGTDFKERESWQVMAVASWNFWEWGKTKFRVDAGRARENQAIDQAKELNDQIALEIKNAYLMLQEAESQIAVSQKVIEQADENFRISEARYKERVARSTEVLDAQTLLTKARSEYANALCDYNISYARLQRAMGVIDR